MPCKYCGAAKLRPGKDYCFARFCATQERVGATGQKRTRTCLRCGKRFTTIDISSYICSSDCREDHLAGKPVDSEEPVFSPEELARWSVNYEKLKGRLGSK